MCEDPSGRITHITCGSKLAQERPGLKKETGSGPIPIRIECESHQLVA